MPEGDTIARLAARLHPALAGRVVEAARVTPEAGGEPEPGEAILAVEAAGKHLLMRFDRGGVLRTHLRMRGRWALHRPGEPWVRPSRSARVVLVCGPRPPTGGDPAPHVAGDEGPVVAVCFAAGEVAWSSPAGDGYPGGRVGVEHLGPDLCRPPVDLATVVARARRGAPERPIGDVLLDQRVAAGVGNVYRNEVLWALGVHPGVALGALDDAALARLYAAASALLVANLVGGARRTVPGGLAVYGRRGRPCRRCGTALEGDRLGQPPRVTVWCPSCQAAAASPGPGPARVAQLPASRRP